MDDTQQNTQHTEGTVGPTEWNQGWNRIARVTPRRAWDEKDILPSEGSRVYVALALFLMLGSGAIMLAPPLTDAEQAAALIEAREEAQRAATHSAFEDVVIEAEAAVVYDALHERILYEKNGSKQLPLASLTKMMTAFVAANTLADDAVVSIDAASIAVEGDSGFIEGARYVLKELLDMTLVSSSNDGAAALASASAAVSGEGFVDLMNAAAAKQGLSQTYFLNETGLDVADNVSGGYGSAHDVALLFSHIYRTRPTLFEETVRETTTATALDGSSVIASNTNKALRDIPFLIGGKTGFTDLAGGNLAVAFDRDFGSPIVVVVLGSTEEGRFADTVALAERARSVSAD